MTDWRQRLETAGAPDARLERELRYRFCAPLLRGAAAWCDVGGHPAAAAAALEGVDLPPRILLAAPAGDPAELGAKAEVLEGDLADREALRAIGPALATGEAGARVVTCLDALETLETFAPLVEALHELGSSGDATVVVALPADTVEELRRLLPADHLLARQVALHGSAIGFGDGNRARHDLQVDVDPASVEATHVLAVFGSHAGDLVAAADVAPSDVAARRALERGLLADAQIGRSLLAERA